MYLVRIDLEMQRPKIVQGWRAENYMRVGTALAYRSVSWYILYHDHRIAIRIVLWPTRIVTPLIKITVSPLLMYWDITNEIDFWILGHFCTITITYSMIWQIIDQINPLRAKLFRGNINIYLHFVSLLHIDSTQVVEILPQIRQEPTYST